VAIDGGAPAGGGDQRVQILDLAGWSIGRGVAAVAAAAPVEGDDAELRLEQRNQGSGRVTVVQRTAGEDQRRAVAATLIGDGGAVGGTCGFDRDLSRDFAVNLKDRKADGAFPPGLF
jgi:hypothetical protein